MLTVNTAV